MVKSFKDTGYWAVILGGSSGLGLATAKKLASQGMNLCLVHRDRKSDLETIQATFNQFKKESVAVISYNLDALNPENIALVLDQLNQEIGPNGKVRVLIHSIAKGHVKPLVGGDNGNLTAQDYAITVNAMALSLVEWVSAIYSNGLFAPDSRVISFTSEGNTKAWKHYAAVSAAKVALEAITRSIAMEYAPYGIRANCIQAGVTDTASLRIIPDADKLLAMASRRNPYKRTTTPEDVANAVYLLCTDESAWINGAVIPVDGGEHLL